MIKQDLCQDTRMSLKITQIMRQGLEILQYSAIDLEKFINTESEENPFIVIEEFGNSEYPSSFGYKSESYSYYNKDSDDIFNNISFTEDLKTHLNKQIHFLFKKRKDIFIAEYITDLLDDNGYLKEDSSQISVNLKVNIVYIDKILKKLKTMDPVGVYSSSISECLELQLKEKGIFDEKYEKILKNLHYFLKNDIKSLEKSTGLCYNKIGMLMSEIKKLNPKPGLAFSSYIPQLKIPDIYISVDQNDDIVIKLYKNNIPKFYINNDLYNYSKSKIGSKDKDFINSKFKIANFLQKSLKQRFNTLQKLAEEIAKEQKEFFKRGILYLKPLKLSDISKKIEMSESTVSRAIKNKFVETNFGTYSMKYFFSSSLKSPKKTNINYNIANKTTESSSHRVKALIASIIDNESKDLPLQDSEISKILEKFNIKIARRTISKYREFLKIPSSIERKRMNKVKF